MTSKTILITGATDGIGQQTARELAQMGQKVLIHARDQAKGAKVINEINRASCNENLVLYISDFADLASVAKMASEIQREQERLDVLINNAGTFSKERVVTRDGNELTFQVNHLAPFLLTHLLLDLIQRSAPSRIVNVSSGAHRSANASYFEDLQGEKSYDGFRAYDFSKLANILFTNELAEQLVGSVVTANRLHPGTIDTKLLRMNYDLDGRSVEDGARMSIPLATSPEVEGVTGKYFSSMQEKQPAEQARDKTTNKKIWEITKTLLREYLPG